MRKNRFICCLPAVLMLMAVAASCSGTVDRNEEKECTLKVSVDGIGRTIRADDITWDSIGTITLSAESENGNIETRSWSRTTGKTAEEVMQADEDIRFDAGTYDFSIELRNTNGTAVAAGTLKDRTIVPGENYLNFVTARTDTGNGIINVKVSWQAEDKVSSATAGLYDISGSSAVEGFGDETLAIDGNSATYSKDPVPVGQYLLRFRFYNAVGTELKVYGDYVEVEADQESAAEIDVTGFTHFYSITYLGLEDATWASGYVPAYTRNEFRSVALPGIDCISRTGYIFGGWYESSDLSGEAVTECPPASADVVVYARWIPATDTAYTVEHWQQDIEGDGYTAVSEDTEAMKGTTGAKTSASAKSYTGFTAGTVTQGTIAADGSTVVKIYYTRNSYTLTFDASGGSAVPSITGKYGAPVTAPSAPSKTGYVFSSWNPAVPSTIPAGDATYTAVWTPATDTAYKVEHYKQNVDGSTYPSTASATDSLTGTTGAKTSASAKTYTGFTAGTVTQGTIAADGSTVVKIYYTRNSYKVSYDPNGGTGTMSSTAIYYGATGTLMTNTLTKSGYSFSGWNTKADGSGTAYEDKASYKMGSAGNKILYAQWTLNSGSIEVTLPSSSGTAVAVSKALVSGSYTFTATVTGDAEGATYMWFLDSVPIAGATSATYELGSADSQTTGFHEVMVAVTVDGEIYTASCSFTVTR